MDHDAIGAEHILLGLLRNGTAPGLLQRLGLEVSQVEKRLETSARRGGGGVRKPGTQLAYTSHAKRLIEAASKHARDTGTLLSAEHLLLAAVREPRGTLTKILGDAGISSARAEAELRRGEKKDAERGIDSSAPRRKGLSLRMFLLAAVPLSLLLDRAFHVSAIWVFATACIGVLPLAGYMGVATEHLAYRTGPMVGGLLNATFGNAAELIISVVALQAGLVALVKASITGSILGNLLLILGLSLVTGGIKTNELRFNRTTAGMSSGMLALAVVALVFPALFHGLHPESASRISELRMSEAVAVILLVTYGLSLVFTLKTHRCLFWSESQPPAGSPWSVRRAIFILALATVGVAIESELLVHATVDVTRSLGLSQTFLGLIIIPIIGNAAEHATAVVMAGKGKVDLSLQIALGSSTQVALLVAPILVFAGLLLNRNMSLVFTPFEVAALGLATLVTAIITLDGESHWFEGVQLLAVYGMMAVGAFFLI